MADIAELLAKYKAQSPEQPVDIESLIVNVGLGLEPAANLPPNISGHISCENGRYVVRANGTEHEYRRRFTMAHELGHFVLHRSILDEAGGVNDSRMYRTDINAPVYNSHIHQIHEQQANSFAANLLMPTEAVRERYLAESEASNHPGGVPLKAMYQTFRVSPSAMRWRLKNLGFEHFYE